MVVRVVVVLVVLVEGGGRGCGGGGCGGGGRRFLDEPATLRSAVERRALAVHDSDQPLPKRSQRRGSERAPAGGQRGRRVCEEREKKRSLRASVWMGGWALLWGGGPEGDGGGGGGRASARVGGGGAGRRAGLPGPRAVALVLALALRCFRFPVPFFAAARAAGGGRPAGGAVVRWRRGEVTGGARPLGCCRGSERCVVGKHSIR